VPAVSSPLPNGHTINFSGALSRVAGENVGNYAIQQGSLDNTNYAITFNGANFSITQKSVTVTAAAKTKMYGSLDPALTFTSSPVVGFVLPNGDAISFTGSLTRVAGETVLGSPYAILQGSVANSNYTITYVGANLTITPAVTTTALTVTPSSQQYSDQVTLTATVTGGAPLISGGPQAAASVTFKFGAQTLGTVNLSPSGANLTASLIVSLAEPGIPIALLTMGSKTMNAHFNSVDPNFYVAPNPASTSLTITQEDARITFTGTQLVATQSSSSGLATVMLRATVQDITATLDAAGDINYGDIRNAKVRFLNSGTPIVVTGFTDVNGWVVSPIALVNPADTKIGVVSLDWPVNIGTATDEEFTISMEVSGYYVRNHQDDNTVITVYKSVGDFITGGGHIIPTQSAGQYASDAGKKTNFGFNVKFNKSNKNLQGNMNIIFRRTVAGVLRVYQIKANSMTSLGVNIANPNAQTAVFTSKCNLTDITNPQLPISLGGNLTLQVNMTDRGEPGSNDDIAISLYNGSTLFYSSKWTGSNTGMMLLAGGNLVVRSGFSLGNVTAKEGLSKIELTEEAVAQEASVVNEPISFDVIAYPNPSDNQFTITLVEASSEKVSVQVFDLLGKLIKVIEKSDGQPIVFGEELPLSTYIAIVTQGDNRKTIKLIKQ